MRLLHFLNLCPKKPKRCLLSRDGNPSLKLLTPSLCHFLSPEIGFCMRKVSVISIASMPPCFSIYAGTCLYLMGKLGRQVGFVYRQGCCPLVQAAFVHLVSTLDSWGQYCFWQTLGSSWHRTCWKQELVITINPLLQSFVFKPFKLSCNLHSNIPHCWWTFRNEPSQVRVLRLWVYFRFVLGILSVTKGFPSTAG